MIKKMRIEKFRVKYVNLDTIIDTLSVVQDLPTRWIQSYPCKPKTLQERQRSLQKFLEPNRKPKVIYTDNSLEFGKACEDLSWNHCTSTPHRSETKGIAERAGAQNSGRDICSGLDKEWWADSMECYCFLRNIQDLLSDGKTPYGRRIGMPFSGPVIPFGTMVEYHHISAKDISRLHLTRHIPRLCVARGRREIWKGDIMIADMEELEQMDASEIHARRLNAKEVSRPLKR